LFTKGIFKPFKNRNIPSSPWTEKANGRRQFGATLNSVCFEGPTTAEKCLFLKSMPHLLAKAKLK
jgi:hypothetical protein